MEHVDQGDGVFLRDFFKFDISLQINKELPITIKLIEKKRFII